MLALTPMHYQISLLTGVIKTSPRAENKAEIRSSLYYKVFQDNRVEKEEGSGNPLGTNYQDTLIPRALSWVAG